MWVDGIIACNFDNKSTVFRIGDKLALHKDTLYTKSYWGDTHFFSYKINSLEQSIIVDSNDCIVGLDSENGSVAVNNYKCFDKLSFNKFKSSKYNKKITQIRAYWGYKQQNVSNTDSYLFFTKDFVLCIGCEDTFDRITSIGVFRIDCINEIPWFKSLFKDGIVEYRKSL